MKFVVRDGVTREGAPGRLYDANRNDADGGAFLDRSEKDPHQFRFVVSADEGTRLADLKPLIRDLLAQMERGGKDHHSRLATPDVIGVDEQQAALVMLDIPEREQLAAVRRWMFNCLRA